MIITPKLNISDLIDINPLFKYSGAMYPLHHNESAVRFINWTKEQSRPSRGLAYGVPALFLGDDPRLLLAKESGHTKICNFWQHIAIHQYILWFKVQMNNIAFLVKVMQTEANSPNYFKSLVPLEST